MIIKKIVLILAMALIFSACGEKNITKQETPIQKEEQPKEVQPEENKKEYIRYEGKFELPVKGSTGFTTIPRELFIEPELEADILGTIPGGKPFEIVEEIEGWWKIRYEQQEGYVESSYCMINLPDVVPSIVYDGINTYASKDRSSGKDIPGVTGQLIYPGTDYNERFSQERFILPVLYGTAKKIHNIQQEALENGETLVVYEGYRPLSAQEVMVDGLENLAYNDEEVLAGIESPPWSMDWFAGRGVSNHQYGYAIDLSLALIKDQRMEYSGDYEYLEVTKHSDFQMPTAINELSTRSIVFTEPVKPSSSEEWKNAKLAPTMTEYAIRLQKYCTDHGLTPLASEWWHFNDLAEEDKMTNTDFTGQYVYKSLRSKPPVKLGD